MSENQKGGLYEDYGNLIAFYSKKQSECPSGVTLKLERKKYLSLQFVQPGTGKRLPKACNVQFTIQGICEAVDKAWKVKDALEKFKTASEFWAWYDTDILSKNNIENDLKTYREIFKEIEDKYFAGNHRNTGRKRERDLTKPGGISDNKSFHQTYGVYLRKFNNLDTYPNWEDIKVIWYSWEQGTKSFKDFKTVAIAIAELCPNSEELLKKIRKINAIQDKYRDKQSISLDDFLSWYNREYSTVSIIKRNDWIIAKKSWLWVASMCVLYGLRPSEIAAAQNLTESFTQDGETIYPLTDAVNNPNCTLVVGEFTFFGTSSKTGLRVINPVPIKHLWDSLNIRNPVLPGYAPSENSKPECIAGGFDCKFSVKLKSYNCPITQKYAFRHLYNQLLEMCGVSTTIRSRLMGHSETTNTGTYKKRRNLKTELAIINSNHREPLKLDMAKLQLESAGFDVNDPSVKAILRIIYQLDN
jgi:integrase